MTHHHCFKILLISALCLAANALAVEQLTIRHGNQSKIHFIEQDENRAFRGINVDVIDELARRMGATAEHIICPFKRCTRMLFKGELDLMMFIAATPERLQLVQPVQIWPNPMPIRFFTRRGEQRALQRFEDLHELRVGTVNGYVYAPRFDHDPKIKRYPVLVEKQLPKMLTAGRIDTFATYGELLNDLENSYPEIALAPLAIAQWDTALLVISRNSPLLARQQQIRQLIRAMTNDGTLDSIWGKYFPGQKMPIPPAVRQASNLSLSQPRSQTEHERFQ